MNESYMALPSEPPIPGANGFDAYNCGSAVPNGYGEMSQMMEQTPPEMGVNFEHLQSYESSGIGVRIFKIIYAL